MKKLITILVSVLLANSMNANNILVSNVSLTEQDEQTQTCKIKFDVSWDNSWRTTSTPGNWDAAWIFIKARINGGAWEHVLIESNGFTTPSGSSITIPSDKMGLFIYRSSNGSGNVNFTDCKVLWNYGNAAISNDASIELKVFAIEMVYVKQGVFFAGGGPITTGAFRKSQSLNQAWEINSENAIITNQDGYYYNSNGVLNPGNVSGDVFTIPADFPKGYNAIYCMKYEISQQQYVDFLNTLNQQQQYGIIDITSLPYPLTNKFLLSNSVNPEFRNGITVQIEDPALMFKLKFQCNGNNNTINNENDDNQNVACNYLDWKRLAAYLDWSALRPMTELEFEKICRGNNVPHYNEFAWGGSDAATNTIYQYSQIGTPNEIFLNYDNTTGNLNYLNLVFLMQTLQGPARCGIFAASAQNPNRLNTGASYYGILEMSGNVVEQSVSIGSVAGRSYTGIHGNGNLLNNGYADVDYWPGINDNNVLTFANTSFLNSGISGNAGIGMRGGSFLNSIEGCTVSNRVYCDAFNGMDIGVKGGRGVRTAP